MRPEGLSGQGALSATPDGSQARERTVLWTPWLLYSSRHPTQHPLQPPVSCIRARLVFLPPSGLRTGAAGSKTGTSTHPLLSSSSPIKYSPCFDTLEWRVCSTAASRANGPLLRPIRKPTIASLTTSLCVRAATEMADYVYGPGRTHLFVPDR